MADITDDQVWDALAAFTDEVQCWRVLPLYTYRDKKWVRAIRDRLPLSSIGGETRLMDKTIQMMDFDDSDTAMKYIRWAGIKAALETMNRD